MFTAVNKLAKKVGNFESKLLLFDPDNVEATGLAGTGELGEAVVNI